MLQWIKSGLGVGLSLENLINVHQFCETQKIGNNKRKKLEKMCTFTFTQWVNLDTGVLLYLPISCWASIWYIKFDSHAAL